MAEKVHELWARVAAGELTADELQLELARLQLKMEKLDAKTDTISKMLMDIKNALDA